MNEAETRAELIDPKLKSVGWGVVEAKSSDLYDVLEFVLGKYVESGVVELDQEKLPILLTNKYQSLEDAKEILGDVTNISLLFVEFQKHLYETETA